MSFVLCVCGNTEVFPLQWREKSSRISHPGSISLFRGFNIQKTIDFHLKGTQHPEYGQEERIVFFIRDQDVDGTSLRVSWSAIHPVDVALRQIDGNFVEMSIKSNAYSLEDTDFVARFAIEVLEVSHFAKLGVFIGSSFILAILSAFYILYFI